jgi:hypothetical protein
MNSARSEIFVDQEDPMEDELRRSGIFRAATRQMSPPRGFCSSEETGIYMEVARTALLKSEKPSEEPYAIKITIQIHPF